jgi:hypothetical protein
MQIFADFSAPFCAHLRDKLFSFIHATWYFMASGLKQDDSLFYASNCVTPDNYLFLMAVNISFSE